MDYYYINDTKLDSPTAWYHGELARELAEKLLRGSKCNCFLVRESRGLLVLSLIENRRVYHFKIEHNLGWYKLQGSVTHSFNELNELIFYYSIHSLHPDSKITLSVACKKARKNPELSSRTIKSSDSTESYHHTSAMENDLLKYHWYHQSMTELEADMSFMRLQDRDGILVRHSSDNLYLSVKSCGAVSHTLIRCINQTSFSLEGDNKIFRTIPDMVRYYLPFTNERIKTM